MICLRESDNEKLMFWNHLLCKNSPKPEILDTAQMDPLCPLRIVCKQSGNHANVLTHVNDYYQAWYSCDNPKAKSILFIFRMLAMGAGS